MAEKGKKVEKSGLWEKIIKKHPGLKKMYPKGFDVYLAGEERRENPQRSPGDIESWPVGETGPHGFPHPSGSNPERPAFEIYSDELWNDPVQLESAVFLDSLHAIPYESEYAPLMNQFRGSFDNTQTPYIRRMAEKYGIDMNNERQFRSFIDRVVIPMFLRGALDERTDAQLGDRDGFTYSFREHDTQAQPSPWKGYDKLYNEPQRDIANKIRKMVNSENWYSTPKFGIRYGKGAVDKTRGFKKQGVSW
jgi:hypothetical protein